MQLGFSEDTVWRTLNLNLMKTYRHMKHEAISGRANVLVVESIPASFVVIGLCRGLLLGSRQGIHDTNECNTRKKLISFEIKR